PTRLKTGDGECCWIEVLDAPDSMILAGPPTPWTITRAEGGKHDTAETVIDLDAYAGSVTLELRYGTRNSGPSRVAEPVRRARTEHEWSGWAKGLTLPPVHTRLVERSAVLLKALTYGPSGALLAAATTSLPEQLGGVRNWDYRFCWPRDAALAATALIRLGSAGEAMRLAEWLVGVMDTLDSPERLRPLYTVTGQELPAEAEIGELAGYGGSRPVRVSNAAATQVQLDVFGPIADMLATLAESGVPVSPDYWRLTRAIVAAVEARWEEPDHGIWEIRGPKRHHVHSRLMCWHAVDRALVVHRAVAGSGNARWEKLRDTIAADVMEKGWHEHVSAFTVAYGHEEMDATALLIGLVGLVDVKDDRWVRTVQAVRRSLQRGRPPGPVTVLRYVEDDGLPGREGGFVICTTWLVEALITLGRVDEARAVLDSVAAQAGRTGTLTEQYDVPTASTLGNFPQAYSHLGFINAAVRLAAVQGGKQG
ncbi:MAG TPA: glycoside hydrolase family 15 protein, partial [Phycisphaerales bacterium]|nr:glycoside hydrolase family 15 protein [Phycisphaerales bacterium]